MLWNRSISRSKSRLQSLRRDGTELEERGTKTLAEAEREERRDPGGSVAPIEDVAETQDAEDEDKGDPILPFGASWGLVSADHESSSD